MIVTKNAYFVDLGKTGTSFVEDVINKYCDPKFHSPKGVRHKGFEELPTDEWLNDNLVFTSVRNPLTYYVSHLAFSRKTNGMILKTLENQGYKDDNYPKSVEGYVSAMMVNRLDLPKKNHNNPEQDAWRNMPDDLGMMTMQYVLLLDRKFLLEKKRTVQEIEDWYEQYWFNPDRPNLKTIGAKNLTLETIDMIKENKEYFTFRPGMHIEKATGYNTDERVHKVQGLKYADWHNKKSIEIVTHYDRILFKHLGFSHDLT